MWLTFLISWLPVKNITFYHLGGPHPVEKLRASWSFSAEEILPQGSRHQPTISSLLACQTDFRLNRLHNHESRFLKISPYLSVCDVSMYLESPLDCKEMKPIKPKGNQPWIFIERTDAETQILWPPDAKSQLTRKDPEAGKDWGQEEKGVTEDEMASSAQWTWVWANSQGQWRTRGPGVLQSTGLQRDGHDWATEQLPMHLSDIYNFLPGSVSLASAHQLQYLNNTAF